MTSVRQAPEPAGQPVPALLWGSGLALGSPCGLETEAHGKPGLLLKMCQRE